MGPELIFDVGSLHLNPGWNLGECRSSVEEVEDDNGHDDGDAGDGHHRGQVDAWKVQQLVKIYLSNDPELYRK